VSQLYVARILEDGPCAPELAACVEGIGLREVDLEDLASEMGVELTGPGPQGFVDTLLGLGLKKLKPLLEKHLASPEMARALTSQRLDLAEGLDFFLLSQAWLALHLLAAADARRSPPPGRRIVLDVVTVHPDAGMPPPNFMDERRFLLRLLASADSVPFGSQRIVTYLQRRGGPQGFYHLEGTSHADDVPGIIWSTRCLRREPLEAGKKSFWDRHRKEWWASEKLHLGSGPTLLRKYLVDVEDTSSYEVGTYEAWLHPCWLERPHSGPFPSTAFWS
jgi:hypothetical protein